MDKTNRKAQSGVAVIFSLGILTLLMVLGVTFVFHMTAENRMASELEAQLRAEQAALGGMERAITELKTETRPSAVETPAQKWFYQDPANPSYKAAGQACSGLLGDAPALSRYSLRITDAASRINVNDQNGNLEALLLGLPGLDQTADGQTRAHWIMDLRGNLPGQKFQRKSQIMLAKGMDQAAYDAVKNFLTLDAYRDPSMAPTPRSPVNINTAPKEVLSAVMRPVLSGKAEADAVADQILAARGGAGGYFDAWKKYDDFINGLTIEDLTADEKENLRDSANPNRTHIWDRTDLLNPSRPKSATEFCFHSGGKYDVECTGEALSRAGQSQAGTELSASLHMHDVLNVTRKQDFASSPEWYRVSWLDSCPVDSGDDNDMGYSADYRKINDSLKAGFWEDFDEDAAYTASMVKKVGGVAAAGFVLEDVNGDGDKEFHHTNSVPSEKDGNFADFEVSFKPAGQAIDSWDFRSSYLKIWNLDDAAHFSDPLAGSGDVGRLRFRQTGGAYGQAYGRNQGLLYVANDPATTGTTGLFTPARIFEVDPPGSDIWVGGTDPKDERFNNPALFLKEIDGSTFQQPFHNGTLPDANPPAGLGQDGHVPPHTEYYLKIPEGAVISDLADGGPDGKSPPNFLFSYNFHNEKSYRLSVFHRRDDDTQGVSMQISDSGGTFSYPSGFGGELNTWMNKRGLSGFKNNGSLAAWDNLRIICPFGDYRSAVLDAGSAQGQWGAVSWTATIPASANSATEKITLDVRSSASASMTDGGGSPVTWTFRMPEDWQVGGLEPVYPEGQYANAAGNDVSGTTGSNQRFVQFRAYLGSTRPDTDSKYCRETPVLEDVTITFFPPARISTIRREGL